VVIAAVIVAGAFLGVNNTLVTTAVMSIAPVERPVASATYGFVRFIGGGLAPFAAAKLAEHYNVHVPFLIGTATDLAAVSRRERSDIGTPAPHPPGSDGLD